MTRSDRRASALRGRGRAARRSAFQRALHPRAIEALEPRALLAGDMLAIIGADEPDRFEPNNSLLQATVLGSQPQVTLNELTINNFGGPADVDVFRIVAPFSGSMTVTTTFVPSEGDLPLAVLDSAQNVIATGTLNATGRQLTIPVVAGESYFARVSGQGDSNVYSLDVLHQVAPTPALVALDSNTDTGRSNTDGVTLLATPRLVAASHLVGLEGIPILSSQDAAAGVAPGAALQITLTRVVDGASVSGYTDRLGQSELFAFTPTTPLGAGRYLLSARWEIRDGQRTAGGAPAPAIGTGPSQTSRAIEIDLTNPTGSEPLLAGASDSGMNPLDGVTNIREPFFTGIGEPNTIVKLFANGTLVGTAIAQSDGRWEITSEPLRDNVYDVSVLYEDVAGRVTEEELTTRIEVDTLAPNTPFLDLVPSSDTGQSSNDNITSDATPTLTMTTSDPNNPLHLIPFNLKFRIFLRPEANEDGSVGAEQLVYDSSTDATIPPANRDADGFTSLTFLRTTLVDALPDGTHNLKLEVEDRAGNISHDYFLDITIDSSSIPPVDINLLPSSDTGMLDTDRVTNKDQPAFWGRSKPGAVVLLFANNLLVGRTTVESDASDVGRVEGATDDDGLGLWEITVEPLDDGVYSVVARVEDLMANIAESEPLQIEIDTLAPNTPALDLVEAVDTGRHNDDNITLAELLDFTLTTTDPLAANHLTLFPDGQNLKYRLFLRPEEGTETLLYSSDTDATIPDLLDGFTAATRLVASDLDLPEGLHNLKLEVEDRAGNISSDFLMQVLVDRTDPVGSGQLHPDSDTGIVGVAGTMSDRITADTTPTFVGTAEANAVVSATIDGQPVGVTVAVPLSGDDAFPPTDPPNAFFGNWQLNTGALLGPGEHTVVFTFEDPAGNQSQSELLIFVDTVGPRVTNVTRNDDEFTSLFRPKPQGGPDPLLSSIVIHLVDTPERTDDFAYAAVAEQLALEEGNYQLVGDANGNVSIVDVNVLSSTTGPGNAVMQIELVFAEPLPDDRFTLTIRDTLADPAGNRLDGESGAASPFEGNNGAADTEPIFPSGDGQPGGSFVARFTVDSRPEIGVWGAGSVWVDTNGNFHFDPNNVDFVNRDIEYKFGFTSDDLFAGNFGAAGATADGFDKLAAYGRAGGAFRWLIDLDNDGAADINVVDPRGVNGLPVAGRFDNTDANGDEVGLFDGSAWHFDTNHDWQVDLSLNSTLRGYPVVGDFDGDGFDDLGTWSDDRFQLDLANGVARGWNGSPDVTFRFGFIGVRERPVSADFDQDGIDDLGLWVPDRQGTTPQGHSEWYLLISGGTALTDRVVAAIDPVNQLPEIRFTPKPFGQDLTADFGDSFALPIVGNFDPPVLPSSTSSNGSGGQQGAEDFSPLDVNRDGHISPSDALLVLNDLNTKGSRQLASQGDVPTDTNRDGFVSPSDALLVITELNRLARASASATASAPAPPPAPVGDDAALSGAEGESAAVASTLTDRAAAIDAAIALEAGSPSRTDLRRWAAALDYRAADAAYESGDE